MCMQGWVFILRLYLLMSFYHHILVALFLALAKHNILSTRVNIAATGFLWMVINAHRQLFCMFTPFNIDSVKKSGTEACRSLFLSRNASWESVFWLITSDLPVQMWLMISSISFLLLIKSKKRAISFFVNVMDPFGPWIVFLSQQTR